jgi:ABC-2 type transport system permease protein
VIRLVRAELLKARTTRLLLWLALVVLCLTALIVSVTVPSTATIDLVGRDEQRSIADIAAVGALMAVILGIVVAAGEYVHGTVEQTFLVTPVRERVVAAKLAAAAIVGALLAVFAEVVTWLVAAAWISSKPVPFQLATSAVLTMYLGILAAAAIAGAIGVGLGALLRRQTAAIVIVLIWLLVAEPVLALTRLERFLPGHALAAMAGASDGGHLLDFWPATIVALVYAGAFATVGAVVVRRADVT